MVNIGAAKEILTTVASGNFLKAINIATKAIKPEIHLNACRPVCLFYKNYEVYLLVLQKNKK